MQDAAGAATSLACGADRVELCTALGATGGLTPSYGALDAAVETGARVHALVRPRPGGFVYSASEIAVMVSDIVSVVRAGAAGVVVGALTVDGSVDVDATAALVDAARRTGEVDVTFHRAIDAATDPVAALHSIATLGIDRVLTSGAAATAGEGLDVLAALVGADTGVQIIAGGGVRPDIVPAIAAVGVDAVHLSAKAVVRDPGRSGPGGGGTAGLEVTDPAVVTAARQALDDTRHDVERP